LLTSARYGLKGRKVAKDAHPFARTQRFDQDRGAHLESKREAFKKT
jgi:hypothetical protein